MPWMIPISFLLSILDSGIWVNITNTANGIWERELGFPKNLLVKHPLLIIKVLPSYLLM